MNAILEEIGKTCKDGQPLLLVCISANLFYSKVFVYQRDVLCFDRYRQNHFSWTPQNCYWNEEKLLKAISKFAFAPFSAIELGTWVKSHYLLWHRFAFAGFRDAFKAIILS